MQDSTLKMLVLNLLATSGLLLPVALASVVTADEVAPVSAEVAEGNRSAVAADEELSQLLGALSSEQFEARVAASTKLKSLNAAELQRAVQLVAKQPSAEAIVRLLAEVDDRYASNDAQNVAAASLALEALAVESRQLIADGAQHSLAHHWLKRMQLAEETLEAMGAVVKKGAFTPQDVLQFGGVRTVQVLIFDSWHGGDEGIDVFKRLTSLVGSRMRVNGGLVVYLLQGHTLTPEQHAALIEIVGADRIQERSRVALGIGPNTQITPRHVLIRSVAKGGSAEAAGIQPGDLITAIENPRKKELTGQDLIDAEAAEVLRDFDDLVERLMDYKRGDVIQLRIVRQFLRQRQMGPQGKFEEEVVSVTLKGWEELEVN